MHAGLGFCLFPVQGNFYHSSKQACFYVISGYWFRLRLGHSTTNQ